MQKTVVRGERLTRQKPEQLPGAGRLPWSGAGSAWGRGSAEGTPQRCGDGHPEAWLLIGVRDEKLRDGGREWTQESGHTYPGRSRGPRSRPAGGRERGTALPSHRPSEGHSFGFPLPGRRGSATATRGRLPDFAQRSPPSLLVFFAWSVCRRDFPRTGSCKALCSLPWLTRFPALITAMSAALKSSHLLPSRSWPCLALLIDPGTFPPEFDLCPRWWHAGKSLSINLDRLCRTNYCSANDRDNPLLIWRVIHFTPVRIFKALISESLLGNY